MKSKLFLYTLAGALGTLIVGCGTGVTGNAAAAANRTSSPPVTLTLWQNYGTEAEATATNALVKAFEKSHPSIKIHVVSQPANNYFPLLQASAISRTGPDITVMWTGLYALKYKNFLLNLNHYIPLSSLKQMNGIKWASDQFNPSKGVYVMPLENQFYIGFYNKALFKKAGIKSPPATWAQLYTDARVLKAHGINPLLYGSGSQNLGSEFYPYYDLSYLMIGLYPVSKWKELYSGQIPWTSPAIAQQLTKWVQLKQKGFTNANVLTDYNSLGQFEKGKAAMLIKGNWDLKSLEQAMGSKLGVFVPPYSNSKIHGVVEFPGDGYSVTKYSQHKPQAIAFLKFLMSPQAQQIEANNGLIPDRVGATTRDPLSNQMLAFASKKGFVQYPMIDNVTQPEVVNAGSKVLDAAFGGTMTVKAALQNLQSTLQQLPSNERSANYK